MRKETIQLVLEAFRSTGHLVVNKNLIAKLGLVEAALLSNYIDKYIYFQRKSPNLSGSFFLRHKDITEQLNITEQTIIRSKKKLIDLGIITTSIKGAPPKEWIKIDFDTLFDLIMVGSDRVPTEETTLDSKGVNPPENGVLIPQDTGGYIRRTNIRRTKKKNIVGGKPLNRVTPIEKRNEKFLPLAQYLHEIISTKKNIKYNAQHISMWSQEIRKLSEMHSVDPIRIKRILRWYKSNIGGQYVPVVESGYSLRMKFLALEAAKERQENSWEDKKKKEDDKPTTGWMSNKFTEDMSPEELKAYLRGDKKE